MRVTDTQHAVTIKYPLSAVNDPPTSSPIIKPPSFSIFDAIPGQQKPAHDQVVDELAKAALECVLNIPMENFTKMAAELGEMAANNEDDSSFSVPLDFDLTQISDVSPEQTYHNATYSRDETIIEIPESVMIRYDLEQFLQNIFQPFRSQDDAQEIDDLIEDRATKLIEENIDAKKLGQLLQSAERRDTITGLLHGAMQGAAPFAGASLAVDLALGEIFTTKVTENLFALGAASGAFQGLIDVVAGSAMQQAFNDAYYTKVAEKNKNASPMMLQWQKEREATVGARTKNLVWALALPYFLRNAVRAGIDIGLTATLGPTTVPIANLAIDSVGGLAAGVGMRYMLNSDDRRAGSMHTAYMLARTDWLNNLLRLDEGISLDGIKRTGSVIIDGVANVFRSIPSGFGKLASWSAVIEVLTLTFGEAVLLPAQQAAGKLSPYGPVAREIDKRIVNTTGLALMYAALAAGVSLTQPR